MMRTFSSMFKNKEIRNKILFTLAMLLIYRVGSAIPVPGVDATKLASQISDNSVLSMMNLLGGGALERLSVFAMGVHLTSQQVLSFNCYPWMLFQH